MKIAKQTVSVSLSTSDEKIVVAIPIDAAKKFLKENRKSFQEKQYVERDFYGNGKTTSKYFVTRSYSRNLSQRVWGLIKRFDTKPMITLMWCSRTKLFPANGKYMNLFFRVYKDKRGFLHYPRWEFTFPTENA